MTEDLLLIGRIARPHGNKGQVVVNPESDFPEDRFRVGVTLLLGEAAEPREVTSARFHHGRPVIALAGVATMNEAEALSGAEIRVPAATLAALPEGTFYRHDLVGCLVQDTDGKAIGQVVAVEGPMGYSRLVIDAPHGEVLIPLVADICVAVEPAERRILVKAPEGLLELNARP